MNLNITHLYPELLNLYGDLGNIAALTKRLSWRGIGSTVTQVKLGDGIDFANTDILFLGGGSSREQLMARDALLGVAGKLREYVENGGVMIAICGGYQLLGKYFVLDQDRIEGLSLLDIYTDGAQGRLTGNVVLESSIVSDKIVGFENHAGRTFIGDYQPLGRLLTGHGNNAKDGHEGVVYKNLVGTYLHGPLLPKNPQLCDWLLTGALKGKYSAFDCLSELPDIEERAANNFICEKYSGGK